MTRPAGAPRAPSTGGLLRHAALCGALVLLVSTGAAAAQLAAGFSKPPPRARCPVCGMFVEPFPEWWAQIVFADGSRECFDGVKDLVRYLGERPRYGRDRAALAIAGVWVLDYYSVEPIAADAAFYVAGSDTLGPMGHEFVPLKTRAAAEEFLRDHRGRAILTFSELPGHPLD